MADAAAVDLVEAGSGSSKGGDSGGYRGIAVSNACVACIVAPKSPGPGCRDEVDACLNDPKCQALVLCATGRGCIVSGTQGDAIACAIDCADQAMVSDFTDPAVNAAETILNCGYGGACSKACSPDGS
jgi:hypothetical protein